MAKGPSYGFDTQILQLDQDKLQFTSRRHLYSRILTTHLGYSICKKLDISIRGLQIQQLLLCKNELQY